MSSEHSFPTITCAQLMAMEFPPIAPEPTTCPTWKELVEAEPRLVEVERLSLRLHPRAAQDDWSAWSTVKMAMMKLVGWEAEQYALRHSAAYDVGYDHLLAIWETGRA